MSELVAGAHDEGIESEPCVELHSGVGESLSSRALRRIGVGITVMRWCCARWFLVTT